MFGTLMLSYIALTRAAQSPVQIFLCGASQWEDCPDFPADVLVAAAAQNFSGTADELVNSANYEARP